MSMCRRSFFNTFSLVFLETCIDVFVLSESEGSLTLEDVLGLFAILLSATPSVLALADFLIFFDALFSGFKNSVFF